MCAVLAFANGIQASAKVARDATNLVAWAKSDPHAVIEWFSKQSFPRNKGLGIKRKLALEQAIPAVLKSGAFDYEQVQKAIDVLSIVAKVERYQETLNLSKSPVVAKPTAGVTSAATKGKAEKEKVASDAKRRTALSAAGTDFPESAIGTVVAGSVSGSAAGSVASAAASDFEDPSKEATEASDAALAAIKQERIRNRRSAVDADSAQSAAYQAAAAAHAAAQPVQDNDAADQALYAKRDEKLTPIMKHVAENLGNFSLASIRGAVGAINKALDDCPERPNLYLYFTNIPSFASTVERLSDRFRVIADRKALSESWFSAYTKVQRYNKYLVSNPIDFNQALDEGRKSFLTDMGIVSLALLDELTEALSLLPAGNQGAPSASAAAAAAAS